MKKWKRKAKSLLIALLLLVVSVIPAQAADEKASYFDCAVFVYGVDSRGQLTGRSVGILVQAGDGSGDTWVAGEFSLASGAQQFLVLDPTDGDSYTLAEPLAGDADSGLLVLRLAEPLAGRTVLPMRTLDGIHVNDTIVVAGITENGESRSLFSRGAAATGVEARGQYSFLKLRDAGDTSLSDLSILPVAAVMTLEKELIGFYISDYLALPAGYLMAQADGIGALEEAGGGESEETPEEAPPSQGAGEPSEETGNGRSTVLEVVRQPSDVDELLKQAEASKNRSRMLKTGLIAAAVLAAGGIVGFALVRSRKADGRKQPGKDEDGGNTPVMGQTEYIDSVEYKKTEEI